MYIHIYLNPGRDLLNDLVVMPLSLVMLYYAVNPWNLLLLGLCLDLKPLWIEACDFGVHLNDYEYDYESNLTYIIYIWLDYHFL